MQNQAVNSMAFVSARFSMQATDILAMMAACSLYVACQALDLRVLQVTFLDALGSVWRQKLQDSLDSFLSPAEIDGLSRTLHATARSSWASTSRLDLDARCERAADYCLPILLNQLSEPSVSIRQPHANPMLALQEWKVTAVSTLKQTYRRVFGRFCRSPNTPDFLGEGSKIMYRAVRESFQVPFHHGLIEHPTIDSLSGSQVNGHEKKTVGGWISIIYEALRDHKLASTIVDAFGPGFSTAFDSS